MNALCLLMLPLSFSFIALQMLPWFAALTVSTVNPLAFYATYMSMLAANSDSLSKGDRADRNTINMAEMGSRHGNVEKSNPPPNSAKPRANPLRQTQTFML